MPVGNAGNQKTGTVVSIFVALSFFFILFGCSTTNVDPHLVAQFKPPVTPTDHETAVYIIRTSAFAGSALTVWVSCNESYVSELSYGSYCYFKTRSGLNTISVEQLGTPVGWIRLDDLPGESVFLKLDYAKGTFEQIPRDQGITLMMLYEKSRKYEGDAKSDRYETALMNPGLVGLNLMKTAEDAGSRNSQDQATITFIRNPSSIKEMSDSQWGGIGWGGNSNPQTIPDVELPSGKPGIPIGIWSEVGWIGNLMEESFIQYQTRPGDHLFFCKGDNWSVLKAKVEAGKRYAILLEASRGSQQANIQFVQVQEESLRKGDVDKWLNAYTALCKDEDKIDASIQARLNAALPLILRTADLVERRRVEPVSITAMD